MDSDLLERKIKLGNDLEKINYFITVFTPVLAAEIREGYKWKDVIKSTYPSEKYFASAVDIGNAYFSELSNRGGEWEYADLADLFQAYITEAKEEVEKARERW